MREIITSRRNRTVSEAVQLRLKKHRDSSRLFLAEGAVLLSEALSRGILPRRVFVRSDALALLPPLPEELVWPVSGPVFEKLSCEDSPDGVLSVFAFPEAVTLPDAPCRAIALENVQDPGNVGGVIRTAAALGIGEVLLCGCADHLSPKAVRASMGAVFSQRVTLFGTAAALVAALKERGCRVGAAVLSPDAVPVTGKEALPCQAVLVGNEGHGLTEEAIGLCDVKLSIPMERAQSLNAAMAAGLFMWELTRGESRA